MTTEKDPKTRLEGAEGIRAEDLKVPPRIERNPGDVPDALSIGESTPLLGRSVSITEVQIGGAITNGQHIMTVDGIPYSFVAAGNGSWHFMSLDKDHRNWWIGHLTAGRLPQSHEPAQEERTDHQ
ncbi:hypothetical protein ACQEU6_24545 [Spirillospora sp. CA-108201]